MPEFSVESLSDLIAALIPLAPWAGGLIVVSFCFRITNEKPHEIINALANLIRGKNGKS